MRKIIFLIITALSFNTAQAQFCPPQPSPIPGLNYACWDHLYFLEQDTVCYPEGAQNINVGFQLMYGYIDNMVPNWLANVSSTWIYEVNGQPYNPSTHFNYQWSFPYTLNIGEIPNAESTQYVKLTIALFGTFPPAWFPSMMGGGVMFKDIYICVENVNEPPYIIFSQSIFGN